MKNWGGNAVGFVKNFLNDLLGKEGTNLDGQPYINGQDPNYLKLDWKQRKKYDEQFPKKYDEQSFKKDLYDNYVMQGNPVLLDFAGVGKRANEVGLNPWGSGEIMFAGAPRFIKSSPPPNIINKPVHIDSPFMDRWYKERESLRGPQLFPLA